MAEAAGIQQTYYYQVFTRSSLLLTIDSFLVLEIFVHGPRTNSSAVMLSVMEMKFRLFLEIRAFLSLGT